MRLSASIAFFLCAFANKLASSDTTTTYQHGYDDLSGVRIDTASAIKDFDSGLIIIKAHTNVTVRLFGTRLHDLKNVRITRSVQSCAVGDSVGTVSADQLLETSPPTAALDFKFPDYSTNYYFCFEWLHPSPLTRARADLRNISSEGSTRPPLRERISRDASEGTFSHQGSAKFISVATAKKSLFG